MSGPYCNTCKHYDRYVLFASNDKGECTDQSKTIYSKHGEPVSGYTEVYGSYYCSSHEADSSMDENTQGDER